MAAAEAAAYAALKIKLLKSENGELASAVDLMGPRVAPQSSSPKSNEPKLLRLKFTKKNQPTAQQIKAAIQVITPFMQDTIKWP
ncbi:hypothetical protein [Schleiferilactobacillus shenzhenensis]|uniref:hypothetical protein n=1 Tax=Schleiferilactobacillus shenzhenensis TaxID=1231337 RepID=UPI00058C905D|nr:hypothetical protein [Schleiferilactobacillus shenzhenensis]